MLPPRGSPKVERYTQTKSKDMEIDLSFIWEEKKRQRRTPHNDEKNNLKRT